MKRILLAVLVVLGGCRAVPADSPYDVVWTSPSADASASMPCGGGDIGLNVWVEDGDVLFYLAQSGTFDENNTMLKLGRVRLRLDPPLPSEEFSQALRLNRGCVEIGAGLEKDRVDLQLWVDVFKPVVHLQMHSDQPRTATLSYESWRYEDRLLRKNESFQNTYKWQPPGGLQMKADRIEAGEDELLFYHRNPVHTIVDATVDQQGMSDVRDGLFDPVSARISGGLIDAPAFRFAGTSDGNYIDTPYRAWNYVSAPKRSFEVRIGLHTAQQEPADWEKQLRSTLASVRSAADRRSSEKWWPERWQRSFIEIFPDGAGEDASAERAAAWRVGRNYALFRYQLACNAYGQWPTKFNGGLFTFDPVFVNPQRPFTPDFRNWGGGTFTAQNQRLVYFPMLKSGDVDMITPQLEFYRNLVYTADYRSKWYWGHDGACFTEQIENFGLPNPSEYGWDRPEGFDAGLEYNKWLEYQWDTALEFCHLAFEAERYAPDAFDLDRYIALPESVLTFYDEHYRYLAAQRGESPLDADGCLRIYPGSGCETYKIADDAASTVAGLRTVAAELAGYWTGRDADRARRWTEFFALLPEVPLRELTTPDGRTVTAIAPARSWERINNSEVPQLYPVWPWRMITPVSEDLELARNTYWYDSDVQSFYTHTGWKQYNIFAACLGLTEEARKLTLLKFADGPHRFPTFWGPGYDWTPDHNWGGTAMIGLQEMLLQADGDRILLFPAWPADWDVHFKLCAPGGVTVEATLSDGAVTQLEVLPTDRRKDIVLMLE